MKWSDLIATSFMNLWRRKLRSFLTMLGVVIGTAAIIIMISLGYGAERNIIDQMSKWTNLSVIEVYPQYGEIGSDSGITSRRVTKITDANIAELRQVANVQGVTPYFYFYASSFLRTGKYQTNYSTLVGVFPEQLEAFGYELKQGRFMSSNSSRLEMVIGPITQALFEDTRAKKNPNVYNDPWYDFYEGNELVLQPINWLGARYEIVFQEYTYDNDEFKVKETPFKASVVGILDVSPESYSGDAEITLVNLRSLQKLFQNNRTLFKNMGITDMSTYSSVKVKVDDMENVEDALKEIKDLGYGCYSNMESINMFRKQIRSTQMFLGLIGGVSMAVAALSIMNTMMMSIYERTREIGVMKVLGCKLGNIRVMFLMEAAFIGIFGGLLGVAFSYGFSQMINNVPQLRSVFMSVMGTEGMLGDSGGVVSIITPPLALLTWAGVTLVSVLSGVIPAQRAMKLSSLAAMRNVD